MSQTKSKTKTVTFNRFLMVGIIVAIVSFTIGFLSDRAYLYSIRKAQQADSLNSKVDTTVIKENRPAQIF